MESNENQPTLITSAERLAMDEMMAKIQTHTAGVVTPAVREAQRIAPPTADAILDKGKDILVQRGKQYDSQTTGERGMSKVVAAFNALEGTSLTEVQGWQFMVLLKLMRSSQGLPLLDNYVDMANYAALAGEAAIRGA